MGCHCLLRHNVLVLENGPMLIKNLQRQLSQNSKSCRAKYKSLHQSLWGPSWSWSGFCLHFPFALLFFTPTALLLFLLHTKVVSPSSCSFCPCPGMLASPDCHMTYSCLLLRSFRSQFRKALCAHGPPQPILTLFIFSTVFVEVSLAFAFIAFLPYQTVRFVRARTYL